MLATIDAVVTVALIVIPILLIGSVVLAIVLSRGSRRQREQRHDHGPEFDGGDED